MEEHPVQQPITAITLDQGETTSWQVGSGGVTRIEATTKSGMHANIPYVRVWRGDVAAAEYCQHSIVGVYFGPATATGGELMGSVPGDEAIVERSECRHG